MNRGAYGRVHPCVKHICFASNLAVATLRALFLWWVIFARIHRRLFSSGKTVASQFVQYQTGIGVAKILCLEITQSQSRDSAQSMSRCLEKGGIQSSFSAHSTTF